MSIITPAYREADNLPVLYQRLCRTLDAAGVAWEWLIVDDCSPDATFAVLENLAGQDARIRGFRLSRNSGSHRAILCGLHQALGDWMVVMASDLQDPPEFLPILLAKRSDASDIVWAVRRHRIGESLGDRFFSKLYYFVMRCVMGLKVMPSTGADYFMINRKAVEALKQFRECQNLFGLVAWMGFRQDSVLYDKQARLHGKSGWTLQKKMALVWDSISQFSDLPLQWIAGLGGLLIFAGCLGLFSGNPTLSFFMLLTGIQLAALGVLGQYVWRILEAARSRPLYLIEQTTSSVSISSRQSLSPNAKTH